MAALKLSILIIFFISVSAAKSMEHWKLMRDSDEIKLWTLQSSPDVTAAFQISSHKAIDWTKVDQKNFIKKYGDNKRRSLQVIGVRDWKINSEEWKKTEYGHELVLKGSYTGPSNQKVIFKETQIYQAHKNFQILSTWPETFTSGLKLADEFIRDLREENKEI